MTDINTTVGTIEHVDPTQVIVEANVRSIAPLEKDFLASIRENGVITPILARRDEQGNIIVRAGQRRTLAAREVGLSTIPAYVVDVDEAISDRIVQQIVENDHRESLTDADRASAFQQLAFEGLTPQVIARRTAIKQAQVKQGLKVAENPFATTAIVEHQLTMDQAAALIEFEGEDDTVASLIEVATKQPEQFAHTAQRARDEKALAEQVAQTCVELREKGFTILDRDPGYYDTDHTRISNLLTEDGSRVTVEDIAEAADQAAFVRSYYSGEVEVIYYVADFKALGLRKSDSSGSTSGPMSDEDKAARRELIANNKAWASAEVVRREWLTTLLSRKTMPRNAGLFVALGVTQFRSNVSDAMGRGNELAHALLGIENNGGYWAPDKLGAIVQSSPTRAPQIALAVVVGGIESHVTKDTWRNPTGIAAAYFTQLVEWGYAAAEVEQIVLDAATVKTDESSAAATAEDPTSE